MSHYLFKMYDCIELPPRLCVMYARQTEERKKKKRERDRDREAVVISSQHPASLPQMTPRGLVLAASYNYHSAGVKDSV